MNRRHDPPPTGTIASMSLKVIEKIPVSNGLKPQSSNWIGQTEVPDRQLGRSHPYWDFQG